MYRYCLVVKGLTPKSELHLISFKNITHESNILNLTSQNKRNDHQLKEFLIVKQILLVSTLRNV